MTKKVTDNISAYNESLTQDERRENARKAGQASGAARRQNIGLRDRIRLLMREPVQDGEYAGMRTDEAIACGIVARALAGDEKCLARVLDVVANSTDAELDYTLERNAVALEKRKSQDFHDDQIDALLLGSFSG